MLAGVRQFITVQRDTKTHEIFGTQAFLNGGAEKPVAGAARRGAVGSGAAKLSTKSREVKNS